MLFWTRQRPGVEILALGGFISGWDRRSCDIKMWLFIA